MTNVWSHSLSVHFIYSSLTTLNAATGNAILIPFPKIFIYDSHDTLAIANFVNNKMFSASREMFRIAKNIIWSCIQLFQWNQLSVWYFTQKY